MDSAKTDTTLFWKRDHEASETEETYATELKCIHGKAYPHCDCTPQDEDLGPVV